MTSLCAGSANVERPAHQSGDGGSLPTPALQSLRVELCELDAIRGLIERQHYSHSVCGITRTYCYAVYDASRTLVGAAIFGVPAGVGVLGRYSENGKVPTLELRRFCMVDDTPRNSESRCLSFMFRDLKRRGIRRILSYADPAFGHQGVIYKATGFVLRGKTGGRVDWVWKGKTYPRRNIKQVHRPFHHELQTAIMSGEAKPTRTQGKLIYVKDL